VHSIVEQTVVPHEVVVIDDASSERYDEAARAMQTEAEARGVAFVYQRLSEGRGAAHARNVGASLARGSVLMFIDDDDTWRRDKVEGQMAQLEACPEAVLAYAGREVVNESGERLYGITPHVEGHVFRDMLMRNEIGTTSSVAVRAEAFRAVGGFDPNMAAMQDYELWLRLTQVGPVVFDPRLTVRWVIHAASKGQMTGRPALYESAFQRIDAKHAAAFASLSPIERRKAYSWRYAMLATRYAQAGSWRQLEYAVRSLAQYPTLAGLSKLLPLQAARQLRQWLQQAGWID
jgi:glycosyltransferase involved in cell wall biosynthesis